MAFQQAVSLSTVLVRCSTGESLVESNKINLFNPDRKPSKGAVFTLQAPVQMLTYCIYGYVVGLAIHVISAGFAHPGKRKVAIFYMVVVSAGFLFYVAASVYVGLALHGKFKKAAEKTYKYFIYR
ncbi:hypothetical protein EDC01DRAFT_683319 [Geopyxis carbonaria]|nr:hypothetical protein EDC01DRAFT_683319 [Geopyxis carbonaria]